jgi:myo-inositol-1(or 4)-monophosphatase
MSADNRRFELARVIARRAGELLRSKLGTQMGVRSKTVRADLVTEADTASEQLIRRLVREKFPDDLVLGEEAGVSGSNGSFRWIVDPLDGTTNFAHGYRCFCVSIAVERNAVLESAVVYDPMADEEYVARKGSGAFCNGEAINVSSRQELRDALLATGFPARKPGAPPGNLLPFGDFINAAQALRRDGSAALDLCYVAAGRFDGFWEPGLHAWDVAAGALIVSEAGGTVSDYRGRPLDIDSRQIVASNGKIHTAMLAVLAPYVEQRA